MQAPNNFFFKFKHKDKDNQKDNFDYFNEVGRWWNHYKTSDEKRSQSDVYYLPCNMEGEGNINAARMDFSIPRGKRILISVTNALATIPKDSGIFKQKGAVDAVKKKMDSVSDTTVYVDDVERSKDAKRIQSVFFDLQDWMYDFKTSKILPAKAITDGYWLALKTDELGPGLHKISRACGYKDGKTASTAYNIRIE